MILSGHALNPLIDSQMVTHGGGLWTCVTCGCRMRKNDMRRHIEANHMEHVDVKCEQM